MKLLNVDWRHICVYSRVQWGQNASLSTMVWQIRSHSALCAFRLHLHLCFHLISCSLTAISSHTQKTPHIIMPSVKTVYVTITPHHALHVDLHIQLPSPSVTLPSQACWKRGCVTPDTSPLKHLTVTQCPDLKELSAQVQMTSHKWEQCCLWVCGGVSVFVFGVGSEGKRTIWKWIFYFWPWPKTYTDYFLSQGLNIVIQTPRSFSKLKEYLEPWFLPGSSDRISQKITNNSQIVKITSATFS